MLKLHICKPTFVSQKGNCGHLIVANICLQALNSTATYSEVVIIYAEVEKDVFPAKYWFLEDLCKVNSSGEENKGSANALLADAVPTLEFDATKVRRTKTC